MHPEQWRQVTSVFHAALAQDPAARAAFVVGACEGDEPVRMEVERLLAAHEAAGHFGEEPIAAALAPSPPVLSRTAADPSSLSDDAGGVLPDTRPRRFRHPFVLVAGIAALVSLTSFVYAASLLIRTHGATKDFGWSEVREANAWVIGAVDANSALLGIEAGDRILTLNGAAPVARNGTNFHRQRLSVGDSYELVVERNGERFERTLVVSPGETRLGHYLIYYLMSLIWCGVGVFIGIARPDDRVARVAFGAAFTTGWGWLVLSVIDGPNLFLPLHVMLGVHFFSIFPTGRRVAGAWKWLLVLGYGVALVPPVLTWVLQATYWLAGLSAATSLLARRQDLFSLRPLIGVSTFYVALPGMLTTAALNYARLTDDNERRRVKWVAYGSMLSLAPQAVTSVAELTGKRPAEWFVQFADAATAGIPLAVAYAVVRYRVFDIRVVVRRGLQYVLAKGALLTLVVAPLTALLHTVVVNRHQTVATLVTSSYGYLYWMVIAGLALRFRRSMSLWVDRRFFREEYDREQLLVGLLDDLGKVESVSQLSELVNVRLESALHPQRIYFWYREPAEFASASASNPLLSPPDFPAGPQWLSWFEASTAPVEVPLPPEAGLTKQQARWLALHGINLVVPIGDSDQRLSGVLLLGPKKSEEPYTASDRRLLGAIARQAAVVRENLGLRARVSDEQRIRLDVLAHLAPDSANVLKECPLCGTCFDGSAERCDRDGGRLTMTLPVTRTIAGKYRLDRLIGKGGMGAVYEARDLGLARDVAVKILPGRAFGQQSALARFRREARAAARLDHPRIVRVHDYGTLEGGGAFIVMERLLGTTLRVEIERAAPALPLADVAEWVDQILDGLGAAHAQAIVHRDLKPENLIGRRDDAGRLAVTIVDFGLAKDTAVEQGSRGSVSVHGAVMGTVGYMSPEQILGQDVDYRTDIFSAGVILAEALTGRRPFDGGASVDVSRAVLYQPYHLPGTSTEALAVDEILQRCLAKDRADRIASADALRRRLVPALRAWAATAVQR